MALDRYQAWLKHRITQESKRRTVELNKPVEINIIYRPHRIDGDEFDWLNRKVYSVTLLLYHATMGTSGVAHQVIGYGIPVVVPNLTEFRYLQKFMSAKINGKPVSGLELIKTKGKGMKRSPDENDAAAKTLDLILDRDKRLQMAQANLLIANRYQADIVSASYDNMVRQKMGLNELAISWWDGKIPNLTQEKAEKLAMQRNYLYQWRAKASLALQSAERTELMPELINLKLTKWQLEDLQKKVRRKDWNGLVVMLRKQLASKDYSQEELEKLIESLILDNKQINLFLDDNLAVELSESLVVAIRS
jgi:hypothetical protein